NYASAKFPSLRPFQPLAHGKLRDGRRAGHRCQMLMAPTGGGKTLIGMLVASEALKKGKRVIFVCDRTTLINQTSEAADRYGLSAHGVIQANHWRFNPSLPFQIASAQTLARRSWPDADVIIIDEAHTQLSAWTEHIPTCSASVIGLSATPFSPGLGKLFTNLINATTMHDLTETGVLVPMKVLSCTQANMDGAATIGGEWSDGAAAERGMQIVGDVVSEWIRFGEGRKTIVFGATIAHCEELCQQFTGAGVMAAVFSSRTTDAERKVLLAEYRKPDSSLRVLISVEALAKGFDVPDVGCVVDCRPLRKSLSTAIQMWGRGLRSSPETGKTDCLLLDHSGNIIRFLDDFTGIFYNGLDALDMGEKLDKTIRKEPREKEIVACPSCGYKPFGKRCMSCGFEAKSAALVEAVPGEMQAVVLGKKKLADDKAHLYAQLCSYARAHSVPEKQAARAAYLFKDITGGWPPHSFRFESTENIPIERNTLNKIKSLNIAHSRGRAAHA
ncbi:MAG: DEAD/DEAH box helicase family protein, partial [Burkholderia gladioli]